MQSREVHHRARIENAAEIRQPSLGRRARDEVERAGVDRHDRHTRGPLGRADVERDIDWMGLEDRHRAASAKHQRREHRTGGDDHEKQRTGGALPGPEMRAQQRDDREKRRRGDQRQHPLGDLVHRRRFEHDRERVEVPPHERRTGGGRGGAEPGQHPDADPCRREQFARQELPNYQKDIKNDREMHGIEQTDGRGERNEPRRMERQRRVELQQEREHVAGGEHTGHEGVAQHSEITHRLVLGPSALVLCPSFVLGRRFALGRP